MTAADSNPATNRRLKRLMTREYSRLRSVFWLAVFSAAMALVEAAIVVHLRHIYYPSDPLAIFPLQLLSDADLRLELAREVATLVMILAVAVLSERGVARIAAAFAFVFGVWDISYYAWLKAFMGWPAGLYEWDLLFLIPWPWFGPWLTPVAVAGLMVLWGGGILLSGRIHRFTRPALAIGGVGTALVLAAFLEPGYHLLDGGPLAFAGYQPQTFAWLLFGPGFVLMAIGAVMVLRAGYRTPWSVQ